MTEATDRIPRRRAVLVDQSRISRGGESWKHDLSGLRPMEGWRAEQVEHELQRVAERRRGA